MNVPEQASPQIRLTILLVVVFCLFLALFARLWFLQVIDAPNAQAAAANNGIRLVYTPAPRGLILDRNGNVLVGNVNEPVIEISQLDAQQNPAVVTRLAALLGMTVKQLNATINNLQYSPYVPVPVMPDASAGQILYVQENQDLFTGVEATTMTVRTYTPMGKAAGNIVGYVGQINQQEYNQLKNQGYQPDSQIGLAGIEAEYEDVLRGTEGVTKLQVDSAGDVLTTLSTTPPIPGDNLRLSINGNIQEVAVQALEQGMLAAQRQYDPVSHEDFQAPAGSAVVEDPNNGQILALATNPDYDPAEFVGGISQGNYSALLNNPTDPLLDRAIQGQYAPGSTFKLVTATAGLMSGLITPTSIFDDTGSITIGNFVAHNDDDQAYGPIDLPEAITYSSDNFFNTIGLNLWYGRNTYGPDYLQNVAAQYGFGKPTGIDLPDEYAGKIPTPASYVADHAADPTAFPQSQWYPGNSDQVAIGQDEDLVTPLQLANAYSAFANGGSLMVPSLVVDAQNGSGGVVKAYGPKVVHKVTLQPAWRTALLAGFEGVVNNPLGTAYADFVHTPLVADDIAGKTGTAQVNAPHQDTSVFTSFAPFTDPQYVVDAFMEDAGYGASDAAPVVREIYDALFGVPLQPVAYEGGATYGGNN